MAKSNKDVVTKINKAAEVADAIKKAGTAAASMLQWCQKGAAAAAVQLDGKKPIKERIEAVMELYADDFASAGHNVKALFKDALTLHAAAQAPISLEVKERGKDATELHTTAAEAASLPKHQMREAAKQVREQNGMGRKTGGGRKAAKTKTPAEVVTDSAAVWDSFISQVDAAITDPASLKKLRAHLKTMGVTISIKRK